MEPRSSGGGKGILAKEYFGGLNLKLDRMGNRNPGRKLNIKDFDYIFIGDSLTFGHGVGDGKNFQSVFEQSLIENNKRGNVINLGQNGSNTAQQSKILKQFLDDDRNIRFGHAYVFLQYFGNDIDYLGAEREIGNLGIFDQLLSDLMDYSYLVDIIYHRRYLAKISGGNYIKFLDQKYSDEEIFQTHANDLNYIYKYVHSNGGNIFFVPFPFIWYGEMVAVSKDLYLDKMKGLFVEFCKPGDLYFDAAKLLNASAMTPDEWVVNPVDAHPSEKLHRLIGVELYKSLYSHSEFVSSCIR